MIELGVSTEVPKYQGCCSLPKGGSTPKYRIYKAANKSKLGERVLPLKAEVLINSLNWKLTFWNGPVSWLLLPKISTTWLVLWSLPNPEDPGEWPAHRHDQECPPADAGNWSRGGQPQARRLLTQAQGFPVWVILRDGETKAQSYLIFPKSCIQHNEHEIKNVSRFGPSCQHE